MSAIDEHRKTTMGFKRIAPPGGARKRFICLRLNDGEMQELVKHVALVKRDMREWAREVLLKAAKGRA